MKKLSNDEKIAHINMRKVLKVWIIIFAVLTIITAVLSLWKNLNPIIAIIFFIIEVILSKYRESLDPKEIEKKDTQTKK